MKKIKKNQLIITALAIMIAAAGYINYTGNLSDIITVNDTVSTQNPTSNPVDEVSGDILSNDAEPDVRVFRNRAVWYSLRVTVCLQVWGRKQS